MFWTNKTGLLTSIQLLTITRYCIMHITINSIHANGSFEVRQVKSHSSNGPRKNWTLGEENMAELAEQNV